MSNPYTNPIDLLNQAVNKAYAAKDAWALCKSGDWCDHVAVTKSRELIAVAKALEAELDKNWTNL
jgi:hypothetical protein